MAFYSNEDEQNNQGSGANPLAQPGSAGQSAPQGQNQQEAGGPTTIGQGSQGGVISAGAPVGATGGTSKPNSSGRFTNIQNYLKANDQANLAGKVTQKVQGVAGRAQNDLTGNVNQFAQDSLAGKPVDYDQSTYDTIKSGPDVASTQGALDSAKTQLTTEYKGPMALGNQDLLAADRQNLNNIGKATQNEGGRFSLLKQFFNKPTYTTGQQKLDNLVLQGNQDQLKQLKGAQNIAGQYGVNVDQNVNKAATDAQGLVTKAADVRNQAKTGLLGSREGITSDLQTKINDFNAQETAREALKGDINNAERVGASGDLQNWASRLGIDAATLQKAGGQYTKNEGTLQNIDPQRAAIINKIAELTGTDPLNIQDQIQKGTYGYNESGVNSELAPIIGLLNSKSRGGYGSINSTLGDTSDLNAAGYDPGQLSRFLNDKGGESGITQVWGGYGRSGDDAIGDLVRYENQDRERRKNEAINNALKRLGAR